jgi:sugar phosphate isomerase/epimerase
MKMKLSIFTDEISADPLRALALAAEWEVAAVEVRGLAGGRFPRVDDGELSEFQRRVEDLGLVVSGVSPGLFKCPVEDVSVEAEIATLLPRSCEWARRWGTDLVSVFGFLRDDSTPMPTRVIDRLAQMAAIAAQHGCRLVLENEAVCWGNTGVEAAAIVRDVGAENFTLLWDPGNSARAGSTDTYPGEYEQLKELVTHVHLKNFDPALGEWSLMDDGIVDWPGQLAALEADGYEGYIAIETHLKQRPAGLALLPGLDALESNSRHNLEYLRRIWTTG